MHVAGGGGSWCSDHSGRIFGVVHTWVNVDGGVQQASFSVDMNQIPA